MIKLTVYRIYALLFSNRLFYKLNLFFFHIGLRGLGILNSQNQRLSGEKHFKNYLLKNNKNPIIFDIGANEGNFCQSFIGQEAHIFAFEPNPDTFERLSNRYKNVSNIQTFNCGLSDNEGEAIMYDYEHTKGSSHASLYKNVIEKGHHQTSKAIKIQLSTIDQFVEKHNIDKIDLLKVDTEGHELSVLKGATKSLGKGIIKTVQFEFNEMNVHSRSFFKDFVELLPDFSFFRLLPYSMLPISYKEKNAINYEVFAFQNIVAIKKAPQNKR